MGRRSCRRHACAVILAAVAIRMPAIADPKPPADPRDPVIDASDAGKKSLEVPVTIINARGDRREGSLILDFESLSVPAASGDATAETIPVKQIRSIEFLRWEGRKIRLNEYAFYPCQVRITLVDGRSRESGRPIPALARLRFRDSGVTRYIHSSFYDYRVKDAWKNSGQRDPHYPELHPHPETIMQILFSRGQGPVPGLLEQLFR
jgi:hypothetical protein